MRSRLGFPCLLLSTVLLSGCVKKSTYETAMNDLRQTESELERLEEQLEAERARFREEMAVAATLHDSVEVALRSEIRTLRSEQRRLASELEEARAANARLETMVGLRGAELQSMQRRLEALRAVEQEVRERNAIYEDVLGRFRSMMDAGQLSVSIDRGRMVIELPQDVLFPSGSASLGTEGREVIREVGRVLADFPDRTFQVEGHTDNVPIATERFPSNWELSSARALAVVRLLIDAGVVPSNLSGAAYGEHQPVAANEDREGRRLNRRIEIVMLPNLEVIAGTELPVGGA
ncbi:MAG: OmpA family protein [Longimicrobiales bacterium]|nr:OmpA family protein [Longimicrobiales bacterium]